jgi:hypothetical protein
VLGSHPHEFESRILRPSDQEKRESRPQPVPALDPKWSQLGIARMREASLRRHGGTIDAFGRRCPAWPVCVSVIARDTWAVDDVEGRALAVLGRTLSNTVSPGVAALMVLAGVDVGTATATGALAGSLSEEGVSVIATLLESRTRRVRQFAEVVESESGITLARVLEEAQHDEAALELLALAVASAARAADDWKVRTLARAFVRGTDGGDAVDRSRLVIDTVVQLNPLHLSVMRVLHEQALSQPEGPMSEIGLTAEHVARLTGIRNMEKAIHPLIGKLHSLGLINEKYQSWGALLTGGGHSSYLLSAFGTTCAEFLTGTAGADPNRNDSGEWPEPFDNSGHARE